VLFVNVLLEQVGLPLPTTPLLLIAGAIAATDLRWGLAALLVATATCVCTDIAWYLAGRRYGNRVMNALCRVSLNPDSCVNQAQRRFERWGTMAIVFAKFIPGLTVIAMPLAGAQRMRWSVFFFLSAASSALWIAAPLLIGALAAPEISAIVERLHEFGSRAVTVVALLLGAYLLLKWWQRRRFYAQLRMARVEPDELHALMQQQSPPTVLDVRTRSARALNPRAIPSALYLPPEDVSGKLRSLSDSGEVVVYCTCPNEASAAQVARLLMKHGVRRVRPLRGGLDAWVTAGYPVIPVG
jgi:membrane protein DedA with SNARE-associated domain/rhodanese-related sulfurtransferase